MSQSAPDLDELAAVRETLRDRLVCTPTVACAGIEDELGTSTRVSGKLEFLQRTGTFKARGALAAVSRLSAAQLAQGVTAVSAGNHAIATAFAAHVVGSSAKIVVTATANAVRIAACRRYGAEVIVAPDVHSAFALAEKIQIEEGRFFVHPFEGRDVALGTGTIALEIAEQTASPDALVVAVGGGGLMGGVASAARQLWPDVNIIGVEPEGADSMGRSIKQGRPVELDKVATIADSLGAPYTKPYSFKLCQDNVDRMVRVSDDAMRAAMGFLYRHMAVAVEPACAATTAALLGPLRQSLTGARIVLVFCGSNTDWRSFASEAAFGAEIGQTA